MSDLRPNQVTGGFVECSFLKKFILLFISLPHDILSDVCDTDDPLPEPERLKRGLTFMETAARAMDRSAMLFMAQSFEMGTHGAKCDFDQARINIFHYSKNTRCGIVFLTFIQGV